MLQPNKTKFYLILMLISTNFLASCSTTDYNFCPAYPVAGAKVGDELKEINAPHFWEWMGRINKLRLQLELCK